jgi:hypothetical protein
VAVDTRPGLGELEVSPDNRPWPAALGRIGVANRWLLGALALTLAFSLRAMVPAFEGAVQDDALQHVFWTLRYRDPELFPGDLFADYYQSTAPVGYAAVYWMLTRVVDPFLASKILSPLLGGVTALFVFLLVRHLHPSPMAAFLATVIASWYIWQNDDLASATPRAFLEPALVALAWALVSGRLVVAVALTTLAALLYPVGGVLGVALLGARLVRFEGWRPILTRERAAWLAALAGGALVAAVLLPSVLTESPYGPVVSVDRARGMPEFGPRGRNAFFVADSYVFWLESNRSGLNLQANDALFPQLPILFELAALAILLPLLVTLRRFLPAAQLVSGQSVILIQLLAASFALFFAAHLVLFRLYLPARYVQWTVPLALSIAAGLALTTLLYEVSARVRPSRQGWLVAVSGVACAAGVALYPAHSRPVFRSDPYPTVSEYLRAQPKDVLVAVPTWHADLLAGMTGRRVLVAREYALAYHLGYYREVRQRVEDLIEAYYDEGTKRLTSLVDRYGVDFFLVDGDAFRGMIDRSWGPAFEPFASTIQAKMNRPRRYALQDLARRCAVVREGSVTLVPATCLNDRR